MNRQATKPYVWATKEPAISAKAARPRPTSAETATAAAATGAGRRTGDLPAGVGADSTHAFVWRPAREAAAVLRALMARDEPVAHDGPLTGMRARQVAAAFVCGLGYEVGAPVVRELHGEEEVEWVAHAVIEEPAVTHATAMAALDHVRQRIEAGDYLERSGADFAGDLFRRACGETRARRLVPSDKGVAEFAFLREAPPQVVAHFIAHEHPQTIALLLSQLEPDVGGAILARLTPRLQADMSYRLATLEAVPPNVIYELQEGLEASMCLVFGKDAPVGGPRVLADLLRSAGPGVEHNVLDQIQAQDPPVAEAVTRARADADKA